jgi:hypothetical protein
MGDVRFVIMSTIIARTLFLIAAFFSAMPAASAAPGEQDQPTEKKMEAVVTTPLSDINLQKRDVPPQLSWIIDDPYSLAGMHGCRDIIAAVTELNAVLGPDFDEIIIQDRGKKRRDTAVTIAGGLVSSLIPFRFLVREVSGANKAEQDYRAAIYAGVVRRGFLKGYGQQRRCKAPGSPAQKTVKVIDDK